MYCNWNSKIIYCNYFLAQEKTNTMLFLQKCAYKKLNIAAFQYLKGDYKQEGDQLLHGQIVVGL